MADVLYSYPSQYLSPPDQLLHGDLLTPKFESDLEDKVKDRRDIYFKIQKGLKLDTISLDKLKQVFSYASPALPPPQIRPPRCPLPPALSTRAVQ